MKTLPIFLAAEFAYGTISEKLALCGRMILTGMGTVFLVLVILWAVIAVFGAAAKAEEKREHRRIMEEVKNSPAPNDTKVPQTPAPSVPAAEPEEDDGALVAVITAAIEAYRAAEGLSGTSYRVVSFRRRSAQKSWNGTAED